MLAPFGGGARFVPFTLSREPTFTRPWRGERVPFEPPRVGAQRRPARCHPDRSGGISPRIRLPSAVKSEIHNPKSGIETSLAFIPLDTPHFLCYTSFRFIGIRSTRLTCRRRVPVRRWTPLGSLFAWGGTSIAANAGHAEGGPSFPFRLSGAALTGCIGG